MPKPLVEITVTLVHQTDLAWLLSDGVNKHWIPRSQGEIDLNPDGKSYTLTCSEYLAKEKGFI